MNRAGAVTIFLLLVIIGVLGLMLVNGNTTSTVSTSTLSTSTTTLPASDQPLSTRISVTFPKQNQLVQKKFTVIGKAPGNWFFEASAPVMVKDKDGSKIAQTTAQVQGDWMTIELVDFTADINISSGYNGPATLVLLKDNPSGLPENDDSVEIPIVIQ